MAELGVGTVVGGLRIEQLAGRGGSSAVHRATELETGHPRAVKVLATPDPAALRRLRREAEILAGVDHPAIVPYRGLRAIDTETAALVTDWIDGETLRDNLRRSGTFDLDEALGILDALADPLDHLHANGFIQRDLSPDNVMIEPDGSVTIIDLSTGRARRSVPRSVPPRTHRNLAHHLRQRLQVL